MASICLGLNVLCPQNYWITSGTHCSLIGNENEYFTILYETDFKYHDLIQFRLAKGPDIYNWLGNHEIMIN